MSKTIAELIQQSHQISKDKGWHDPGTERSVGEDIALMHSELSEALEEFREGKKPGEIYYEYYQQILYLQNTATVRLVLSSEEEAARAALEDTSGFKPCGIPVELADVLIRIFDFCGKHNIDLEAAILRKMSYNATRPHRHGGKKL